MISTLADTTVEGDRIRAEAKEAHLRMEAELESARQDAHARTAQAARAQAEADKSHQLAEEMQVRLARMAARAADANRDLASKLAAAKEENDKIRADAERAHSAWPPSRVSTQRRERAHGTGSASAS